jgi:hypothetical protein
VRPFFLNNNHHSPSDWNISTLAFVAIDPISQRDFGYYGFTFSNDGHYVYNAASSVNGAYSHNGIDQYALSTPWNITTMGSTPITSLGMPNISAIPNGSPMTGAYGGQFSSDGTKFYFSAFNNTQSNTYLMQYNLSTPYMISTAIFSGIYISVSDIECRIYFSNDGSIMYLLGSTGGDATVYMYHLGTPWDLSTFNSSGTSYNMYNKDGAVYIGGLGFSVDGTKMYAGGYVNTGKTFQFTLSTPWDITTATNSGIYGYLVSSCENGIFISPDGFHAYAVDSSNYKLSQYSLT